MNRLCNGTVPLFVAAFSMSPLSCTEPAGDNGDARIPDAAANTDPSRDANASEMESGDFDGSPSKGRQTEIDAFLARVDVGGSITIEDNGL